MISQDYEPLGWLQIFYSLFGWHMNSARLAFFLPISSHIILFILPAEHLFGWHPIESCSDFGRKVLPQSHHHILACTEIRHGKFWSQTTEALCIYCMSHPGVMRKTRW
jgi:hypothetical protein